VTLFLVVLYSFHNGGDDITRIWLCDEIESSHLIVYSGDWVKVGFEYKKEWRKLYESSSKVTKGET
jgi:hypothetical protein